METTAISSAMAGGIDTDSLLKLIETIRAEKTGAPQAASDIASTTLTQTAASTTPAVAVDNQTAVDSGDASLPALGRYVNIWA